MDSLISQHVLCQRRFFQTGLELNFVHYFMFRVLFLFGLEVLKLFLFVICNPSHSSNRLFKVAILLGKDLTIAPIKAFFFLVYEIDSELILTKNSAAYFKL